MFEPSGIALQRFTTHRYVHDGLLQEIRMELLGSRSLDQAAASLTLLFRGWRNPSPDDTSTARTTSIEMAWKAGVHILRDRAPSRAYLEDSGALSSPAWISQVERVTETESEAAQRLLRFLSSVTSMRTKQSEELILEWVMYSMRFGSLKAAYERLVSLVALHPYNEHPLLIGYAGMLCLLIWKQSGDSSVDSHYFRQAQMHLEESLRIHPSADLFTSLLAMMYQYSDRHDVLEELLLQAHKENQDNPNTLRRLLEYYHAFPSSNTGDQQWVMYAEKLLQIDPLSDPASTLEPLVDYYTKIKAYESIVKLIAVRLDYGSGKCWMWDELCKHLVAVDYDTTFWQDRMQWWPSLHFFESPPHGDDEMDDYFLDIRKYAYTLECWVSEKLRATMLELLPIAKVDVPIVETARQANREQENVNHISEEEETDSNTALLLRRSKRSSKRCVQARRNSILTRSQHIKKTKATVPRNTTRSQSRRNGP
ncbi:hypothetical protein BSLG_002588 [Batrachochytrium salamandrivorans]|nr:hypothetical protein BSLG_002588 [Batrachochytrium salamandrivorans]